ncbi:ABC transporter ATP-binding protein [Limnohabitans sp. Rim11]|uniref:ABC transporter ATP-binding protein n=1 Tax=Limnohabitans sp. Rim11 TaxID=1100719 RepID=UPI000A805030|nr:ABC transporter ATP-binding protein [Limnohabitans sp. Rim11]
MGSVVLEEIHKSYGQHEVIRGVNLEVKDGEFLVFVGPSGCGKSTTLRMIAGLEDITSGQLTIDGVQSTHTHPADRGVAMVFQSYALYPHMTVEENMGFSLKMSGMSRKDREVQVRQAAEVLKIDHMLARYPKELSGGERQRVAIGRAIVRKPKVFLFDEPLSNLDAALRVNMRIELSRLHKELGTTMIYVTHDQVEAMTMGDRIAVFNQGKIEQLGAPLDLYNQPCNTFVATFLGAPRINLIEKPLAHSANEQVKQWWQQHTQSFKVEPHAMGIRPEHIDIVKDGSGLSATVVLAEHLGDASIYHCQVEGFSALLNVKSSSGSHFQNGDHLHLQINANGILAFNGQGLRIH